MLNTYFAEMIPWRTYLINLITSFEIYSLLPTQTHLRLYFIPCHTQVAHSEASKAIWWISSTYQ